MSVYTVTALAEQVKAHMDANNMTIQALATATGFSRTTLSLYINGKYTSDPTSVESTLRCYLAQAQPDQAGEGEVPDQQTQSVPIVKRTNFFESKDAKNVIGICAACQEEAVMGQIVGKSGRGKTHAVKQYARMPKVIYLRANAIMGKSGIVRKLENELKLGKVYGTLDERVEGIVDYFDENPVHLLIIDEANKLLDRNVSDK